MTEQRIIELEAKVKHLEGLVELLIKSDTSTLVMLKSLGEIVGMGSAFREAGEK